METGKSKICSVGEEAGNPGELMVQMKPEVSLLENSSESVFLKSPRGDSKVSKD